MSIRLQLPTDYRSQLFRGVTAGTFLASATVKSLICVAILHNSILSYVCLMASIAFDVAIGTLFLCNERFWLRLLRKCYFALFIVISVYVAIRLNIADSSPHLMTLAFTAVSFGAGLSLLTMSCVESSPLHPPPTSLSRRLCCVVFPFGGLLLVLISTAIVRYRPALRSPDFSIEGGITTQQAILEVSSGSPAFVRYTLDGTDPRRSFSGKLARRMKMTINHSCVIRAACFLPGFKPSKVASRTYIIPDDVVKQENNTAKSAWFPTEWYDRHINCQVEADYSMECSSSTASLRVKQSLSEIPTMALVMEPAHIFGVNGVYSNATQRGKKWERPCSMEFYSSDVPRGIHVDCGIRISGNMSRRHDTTRKHSFRLKFTKKYGVTRLRERVFQKHELASFDSLVLRGGSSDSWLPLRAGIHAQFIRDEFVRRTQIAMGQTSPIGRFVHLYLNGLYWGLYNLVERPDGAFAASYHGGSKGDWDVIKDGTVFDGSIEKWNHLMSASREILVASEESEKARKYQCLVKPYGDSVKSIRASYLIDITNYIDYLILMFYCGNTDWPSHNYVAARKRGSQSTGFKFFSWDAECTLNLDSSVTANLVERLIANANHHESDNVATPFINFLSSQEFRIAFSDRVQKHLVMNDGALFADESINRPSQRYNEIATMIAGAVAAESARWGDQAREPGYTTGDWMRELDYLLNGYFPNRSRIVLAQLDAAGLYRVAPKIVVEETGAGQNLIALKGAGVIYFTLDGTDPRKMGGKLRSQSRAYYHPFWMNSTGIVKARSFNNGDWSAMCERSFCTHDLANDGSLERIKGKTKSKRCRR